MENERRKKEENEKVKSRKWLLFLSLSLSSLFSLFHFTFMSSCSYNVLSICSKQQSSRFFMKALLHYFSCVLENTIDNKHVSL